MGSGLRRIAVISVHTSPLAALGTGSNGGLNVYVREVCRGLSDLGVATDVFTRVPSNEPVRVEPVAPLSRVVNVPLGSPTLSRYEMIGIVPEFTAAVQRTASSTEYDALYTHYWLSGLAGELLRERLDIPWVHIGHTWGVVKNAQLAPEDTPEPGARLAVERDIVSCADLVVVSSESERRALEDAYGTPQRTAVIMPGVDPATFHARSRERARRELGREGQRPFVVVGRLERLKGIDIAIRAISTLVRDHPDVRLLVIGGDGGVAGEGARLRALSSELSLDGHVEFCGPMPQKDLALHYAAAEACVMPSYSESFGLVGLEAQACGAPVIASQAAGLAAVIGDGKTGFLVASGDVDAFAAAMRRLLDDPSGSERMSTAAARLADDFSWQSVARRLLNDMSNLGDTSQGRLAL